MSNVSSWKRHQVIYEVPNRGAGDGYTGGAIRDLYDLIRNAERYAAENGIDIEKDDYATWEADDESLRVVFQVMNGQARIPASTGPLQQRGPGAQPRHRGRSRLVLPGDPHR